MKKIIAIFAMATTLVACSGKGTNDSTTDSADTINTVVGANGKIWMDRNLGATRVATSSTDEASYGDLYQWGRGADGHQLRNSTTTTVLSSTDDPGNELFILASSIPYDWRSGQNANLWQGVNGINNPCPSGFRLPTKEEWEDEISTWTNDSEAAAFASPLKLPAAGARDLADGSLGNVGIGGYYWSSTVSSVPLMDSGAGSVSLGFGGTESAKVDAGVRGYGVSVRCIKD